MSTFEKKLKELDEKFSSVHEKLISIDNYGLERLSDTLIKIIELVKEDKDIVKLVLENRKENA